MKSSFRATALLSSSSIASILVSLASAKVMALCIQPEGYGYYGLLQSFVAVASLLAGMGMATGLVRKGAGPVARNDLATIASLRRASWLIFAVAGSLAMAVVCAFRTHMSQIVLGVPSHGATIVLMGVALLFTVAGNIQVGTLNAYHRVSALAKYGVVSTLLSAGISIAAVLIWRVQGIGVAVLGGAVANWIVSSYLLKRDVGKAPSGGSFRDTLDAAWSLIRFGAPYTASMMVGTGVQLVLPIVILHLLNAESVGYYRAAAAISVGYLGFLVTAMGQDYFPRVSAAAEQPEQLARLINAQHRLVMLVAVPMILATLAIVPYMHPNLFAQVRSRGSYSGMAVNRRLVQILQLDYVVRNPRTHRSVNLLSDGMRWGLNYTGNDLAFSEVVWANGFGYWFPGYVCCVLHRCLYRDSSRGRVPMDNRQQMDDVRWSGCCAGDTNPPRNPLQRCEDCCSSRASLGGGCSQPNRFVARVPGNWERGSAWRDRGTAFALIPDAVSELFYRYLPFQLDCMILDQYIPDTKTSVSDCLSHWTLVTAVNNEAVLRTTLLASPDIDSHCQVIIKERFDSAGLAYNSGLSEATSEVVVFAHQDVYLPQGWKATLSKILKTLERSDPNWGVLGVFGVSLSGPAELRGHCYSTGLKRVLGEPFDGPIEARVLDELLLILRGNSGLRFDERLPNFHLYGADICLQAQRNGMKSYIIPAFCIHNSNGVRRMPLDYWRSYAYMRRKWRSVLPVRTCCSTLSTSLLPLAAQVASDTRRWLGSKREVGTRCDDVAALYQTILDAEDQVPGSMPFSEQHA